MSSYFVPWTGYYSAETLYGDFVCRGCLTLAECEDRVRDYQRQHGNLMCKITHETVLKKHLKIVDPL